MNSPKASCGANGTRCCWALPVRGKTFTMANVIQNVQRPTLVLTHNKTLVAQLYGEFKQFFPDNAVEYFVSYYDYYQPEAYLPVSDTYIEKDLNINEELDKLRLRATTSLLSGPRDIIVVASVSCIYGMGNPTDYESGIIRIAKGRSLSRQGFLHALVIRCTTARPLNLPRHFPGKRRYGGHQPALCGFWLPGHVFWR
jgi:excinuclease ABC subunit B